LSWNLKSVTGNYPRKEAKRGEEREKGGSIERHEKDERKKEDNYFFF